jgi:predicted transcriptional regulator
LETYGWEICEAVKKVDKRGVVIDTRNMKKEGRGRQDSTRIV